MGSLLQSLPSIIVTALLTTYLTATFGLRRYQNEKVWERKTTAYTAIFEALHEMRQWFKEHIDALEKGDDISDDKGEQLAQSYRAAKADLDKRLTAETWLLPASCLERLQLMEKQLDQNHEDWVVYLEYGLFASSQAISDLRLLVQEDLRLAPVDRLAWLPAAIRNRLPWRGTR